MPIGLISFTTVDGALLAVGRRSFYRHSVSIDARRGVNEKDEPWILSGLRFIGAFDMDENLLFRAGLGPDCPPANRPGGASRLLEGSLGLTNARPLEATWRDGKLGARGGARFAFGIGPSAAGISPLNENNEGLRSSSASWSSSGTELILG